MSIKTDFSTFIDDYPTWVIHVKQDRRFTCRTCYSEATRDGEGLCPDCIGTGSKISYVKMPVRIMRQRPMRSPDVNWPHGELSTNKAVIYTKHEYYVKFTDLILEVSWNVTPEYIPTIGQPVEINHIYKVNAAEPFYEDEISFITCTCEILDSTREFVQKLLQQQGI